jgi:hypothetical protein
MDAAKFNNLAKRIVDNSNWFGDVVGLCREYYKANSSGGGLHIVLDDGNLDDGCVGYSHGFADAREDESGGEIAALMELMTLEQRRTLYDAYSSYAHP